LDLVLAGFRLRDKLAAGA